MSERQVSVPEPVPGPAGPLEAIISYPVGRPAALALVCHPHPLHQGTMHNKVTVTVARAFEARGALTLRFNFRGVGASAGTHADGIGELEDALAVAAWMRARWPGTPLHIGGFSFGALITAKVAESVGAASLVSIALPVRRLAPFTDGPRCPWLVVHGREDDVVECDEVERWVAACAVRPRLVIIPAAGHYFHGKLRELTDSVGDFLLALDDVTAAEHA